MSSAVTVYDAAGCVTGTITATGRRVMLNGEVAPTRAWECQTLGQRAMRVAKLYRVSPSLFSDAAMDAAANASTARQADAETRRRALRALMRRDVAPL